MRPHALKLAPQPKWLQWSMFPPHTQSSHSSEGTARALLNYDKAFEDDFQTQHILVRRVMWWEDNSHRSSAEGHLECSGGSPGQWAGYCMDISEEEELLETVDPTWWTTHWLQLAVHNISDDEVPWYADDGGRGCCSLTSQVPPCHLVVECKGAGAGHLPTCSDCPEHRTVHDMGRGTKRCEQLTMVRGILLCLAERLCAVSDGSGQRRRHRK